MHRIGIVVKLGEPRAAEAARQLSAWLSERGHAAWVQERLVADLTAAEDFPATGVPDDQLADECDLIVVLGGDGTLLYASRLVATAGIPIFPVNLGHLGFLCNAKVDNLFPHMERVLAGDHTLVERLLLAGEIRRDGERVAGPFWALNDMVVHLGSIARMLELRVAIDGFVAVPSLKADGLIVSSPTGSTAYNLSAGGPILAPTMQAMILAPILPLSLSQRPVVVDGGSEVDVELIGDAERAYVTCDGQERRALEPGDQLAVRRAALPARVVDMGERTFYQVLRHKMGWALKPGEEKA